MANTKLIVLCIALVLVQESLCLGLSLGSFLKEVAEKNDKLGDAAKSLLGSEEEESVEIDDLDDEDNEVSQEESKQELDEDAGDEEVEEVNVMTRLAGIEKECKGAKRIGKKQLLALNTLIRMLNETKNEKCSAPADTEVLPKNCKEVLQNGNTASGVYTIGLPSGFLSEAKPVQVYCDMDTDGGGWLVFQRRKDGSQNFQVGWSQYMVGFGDMNSEFWLGNLALNLLSTSTANELRVDMRDGENVSKYAHYGVFRVASEAEKFRLTVGGYSGDAGDSLSGHNGYKFSTIDQDNDVYTGSCSSLYKGAWWYSKCHSSNLNGPYLNGAHKSYADGVDWKAWHGYHYSLQFTEMKMRPLV